jgi:exonuclease III
MSESSESSAQTFKIFIWNVNGIRAIQKQQALQTLLDRYSADIYCFQESKITPDALDNSLLHVEGYAFRKACPVQVMC